MQDDSLLSGTIKENITFFDQSVNENSLLLASTTACIHEDIMRFPMGYNTLVGEMGSSLSGGQKQRIYFARALYHSPDVLMLDEGTANLDVPTELQIARSIENFNGIKIIVAHRPALIEASGRVFFVEKSQIIEISGEIKN